MRNFYTYNKEIKKRIKMNYRIKENIKKILIDIFDFFNIIFGVFMLLGVNIIIFFFNIFDNLNLIYRKKKKGERKHE